MADAFGKSLVVAAGSLLLSSVSACSLHPAPAMPTSPMTKNIVSEGAYVLPGTHQFVIHSERVGRDFLIVVSAPPSLGGGTAGQKLPTIYALDGGQGVAGPIAQFMALPGGGMSPAYVVSISDPQGEENQRNTDLIYTPITQGDVTFGGGGPAFRLFLTEELRPLLEGRYPLDPRKAILFGHSFGGLFAANALAEAPESFSGYVIASAQLSKDPQIPARLAAAAAKGGGRRVLVAVGEKEVGGAMLESANQIAAALTAPGSTFKVEKRVFAGEGHVSYYPLLAQAAYAWLLPAVTTGATTPAVQRAAIPMTPEALERLVGVYAAADGMQVTITRRDATLFALVGPGPVSEALAETPLKFFFPRTNIQLAFGPFENGPAQTLLVTLFGREIRTTRKAQ